MMVSKCELFSQIEIQFRYSSDVRGLLRTNQEKYQLVNFVHFCYESLIDAT